MNKFLYTNLLAALISLGMQVAHADPILAVNLNPGGALNSNLNLPTGSVFSADIVVNNITDLAGFDFTVNFDSSILSLNSFSSGNFFGASPDLSIYTPSAGALHVVEGTLDSGLNVDNTTYSVLASLQFQIVANGASGISFGSATDSIFSDSLGNQINITPISASVSSVPLPASAWLFASAIIGLMGVKSRKPISVV